MSDDLNLDGLRNGNTGISYVPDNVYAACAIRYEMTRYLMLIDDNAQYDQAFATAKGVATHELTKFVQWLERENGNGEPKAECGGNCDKCKCEGKPVGEWLEEFREAVGGDFDAEEVLSGRDTLPADMWDVGMD